MTHQLFYSHVHWNVTRKFLVRFAVVFFGLLILPILSLIGDEVYPLIARSLFSVEEISIEANRQWRYVLQLHGAVHVFLCGALGIHSVVFF